VATTNDPKDAFEALVAEANETNKKFKNYKKDNNFLILALGDADEISIPLNWRDINLEPNMPTGKGSARAWGFYGRIMGEDTPHHLLPMPCFDFVRERWGEAWRTKSPTGQEVPGVLTSQGKGYDKDQIEQQAAEFNQDLVDGHTYFVIPKHKAAQRPALGDIWTASLRKGVEWNGAYNITSGEAKELRSEDILKIENWEKALGPNKKFYYTTTKKSCDNLEDLFEEKAVESGQIEECGELCCIEADDWHTFEKTNHPVWKTFGPTATTGGGKYRLKTKPCEGYVVKRPATYDQQFNKLTDIVKKEIDWWACGDVKKAWGSKMDSTTLAEFDIEPAGGWDNTRSEKCSGIRKEPWDAAAGGLSDRIEAYELELSKTWNVNLEDIDASPHATDIPAFFVGQLEDDRLLKYFKKTWNRWKKDLPTDEDTNWTTAYIPERWVLEKENHWSAITVSWLLLEVDPTFPAAAAHTTYVFRTMGFALSTQKAPSSTYSPATHGWTAWVRGSTTPRIVAQLGDVLWKPRAGKTITDSHADVVSRIAKHDKKTYAYLAGGNISDTMVGWRTTTSAGGRIKLNDDGTYPPASGASDYQIVLKKDGRIVPAEKTPAVAEVTPGTGDTGL